MSTGLTGVIVAVCVAGIASQYSSGVMERVLAAQQRLHHLPMVLPQVNGYIAVSDCSKIGRVWTVNGESMLVSDCAGDNYTRQWMARGNIIVEIDFDTAKRWHTVGLAADVKVCKNKMIRKME